MALASHSKSNGRISETSYESSVLEALPPHAQCLHSSSENFFPGLTFCTLVLVVCPIRSPPGF